MLLEMYSWGLGARRSTNVIGSVPGDKAVNCNCCFYCYYDNHLSAVLQYLK